MIIARHAIIVAFVVLLLVSSASAYSISDQGAIEVTKQSAEDLALILRSGALPAPVKIIEEGAINQ